MSTTTTRPATGHLMDLPGVGPIVAARVLADVGEVARFADRNRFAGSSRTGRDCSRACPVFLEVTPARA